MERKLKYQSPAILEELKLEMEGAILADSHVNEPIEEDVDVVSIGQTTEGFEGFDFEWEF